MVLETLQLYFSRLFEHPGVACLCVPVVVFFAPRRCHHWSSLFMGLTNWNLWAFSWWASWPGIVALRWKIPKARPTSSMAYPWTNRIVLFSAHIFCTLLRAQSMMTSEVLLCNMAFCLGTIALMTLICFCLKCNQISRIQHVCAMQLIHYDTLGWMLRKELLEVLLLMRSSSSCRWFASFLLHLNELFKM